MRSQNPSPSFGHAIVLGGSIAGLLATRVLSDHFQRVTLVERDELTDAPMERKGTPQGRHAHGLLAWGLTNLNHYFPGLRESLIADGAVPGDMSRDLRWYQHGTYKLQFPSGFEGLFLSRPLVEQHIRRRVLALPNVTCLGGTSVDALLSSPDQQSVCGVVVRPARAEQHESTPLLGDLVVDATGRGSRTPERLERLGYAPPPVSEVRVDIAYATRLYRRTANGLAGAEAMLISPVAPRETRIGVMFPIEGDRWIVTLGGWHGDHATPTEEGFRAFARGLPAPDIAEVIERSEPLSDVMVHKLPSSLRRHYERLTRFPERFLVIGDAIASFNPVYGQGMTSATLQASALDDVLRRQQQAGRLQGMWRHFFRQAARVVDIPWQITVGEDFRFAQTTGQRPPLVDTINAYVSFVQRASAVDREVARAFMYVMNLQKPPMSIFAPRIVYRTFRALRRQLRPAPVERAPKSALAFPNSAI
ncbi:MAG: hypothetical protein U0132_00720 [Gemmatimonadaceae bacterium]